jgi:hypothetical protein
MMDDARDQKKLYFLPFRTCHCSDGERRVSFRKMLSFSCLQFAKHPHFWYKLSLSLSLSLVCSRTSKFLNAKQA